MWRQHVKYGNIISMTVREIQTVTDRNKYGDLRLNYSAIKDVFPDIKIKEESPGAWGHNGNLVLREPLLDETNYKLIIPSGEYKSNKHYHSCYTGIVAVESGYRKLNFSTLFLLVGIAYNGDYRSLKKTYWLLGKNEDSSYFLHKIRPKAVNDILYPNGSYGEVNRDASSVEVMNNVRKWMWSLKRGEEVAARQGDVAFIPKNRASGTLLNAKAEEVGNHLIYADAIKRTVHKIYFLNPVAKHPEHYSVQLEGWYEVRMAKQWELGYGD